MPILSRENLARRFRQNWLSRSNTTDAMVFGNLQVDDSLTSLSWLQNLSIMNMASPAADSDMPKLTPRPDSDMRVNPNAVLNMQVPREYVSASSVHPPTTSDPHVIDKVDYKTNPYVKPPYSYATLICMAMKETKKNKITLAGIYSWITENFLYYRMADPSWQNSIRHNLSLNKCFQKVARRKDEPGKGGFWRINPDYSDMFINGVFKRRRSSVRETASPPLKKVKREMEETMLNAISGEVIVREADDNNVVMVGTDFNWNNILQQDIEIGGMRIKTEQLLDEQEVLAATDSIMDMTASPITELSPPPSDSNSDTGLDDFLNYDLNVDLTNGDPLDLSITGTSIKAPGWWSESQILLRAEHPGVLNTPISQSPITVEDDFSSHPWAESRCSIEEAISNFDLELHNLFNDDSLTNSSTYSDS